MGNSREVALLRDVIEDVGRRMDLEEGEDDAPTVYGEREGYLVQVEGKVQGRVQTVVERIRYGGAPEDRERILAAIRAAREVKAAGIRPEDLHASGGTIVYVHQPPPAGASGERIAHEVAVLVGAMKRVAPPLPASCRQCGAEPAEVDLVRDVVDRLCFRCRLEEDRKPAALVDRPEDTWVFAEWRHRYRLRLLLAVLFAAGVLTSVSVAFVFQALRPPTGSVSEFYVIFGVMLVATFGTAVAVAVWVLPRLGCPKCGRDPSLTLAGPSRHPISHAAFNPEFCLSCGVRLRPARPTGKPRAG